MTKQAWIGMALALFICVAASASEETWKKDLGKEGPQLRAVGWTGTPVALDAVRGNAVVLAFWNADVAC